METKLSRSFPARPPSKTENRRCEHDAVVLDHHCCDHLCCLLWLSRLWTSLLLIIIAVTSVTVASAHCCDHQSCWPSLSKLWQSLLWQSWLRHTLLWEALLWLSLLWQSWLRQSLPGESWLWQWLLWLSKLWQPLLWESLLWQSWLRQSLPWESLPWPSELLTINDNHCCENLCCDSHCCDNLCCDLQSCDDHCCENHCCDRHCCDFQRCENHCYENDWCDSHCCDNHCCGNHCCDFKSSLKRKYRLLNFPSKIVLYKIWKGIVTSICAYDMLAAGAGDLLRFWAAKGPEGEAKGPATAADSHNSWVSVDLRWWKWKPLANCQIIVIFHAYQFLPVFPKIFSLVVLLLTRPKFWGFWLLCRFDFNVGQIELDHSRWFKRGSGSQVARAASQGHRCFWVTLGEWLVND